MYVSILITFPPVLGKHMIILPAGVITMIILPPVQLCRRRHPPR